MWSGCKDSQTSADTVEAGSATGAMSFVSTSKLWIIPRSDYHPRRLSPLCVSTGYNHQIIPFPNRLSAQKPQQTYQELLNNLRYVMVIVIFLV